MLLELLADAAEDGVGVPPGSISSSRTRRP